MAPLSWETFLRICTWVLRVWGGFFAWFVILRWAQFSAMLLEDLPSTFSEKDSLRGSFMARSNMVIGAPFGHLRTLFVYIFLTLFSLRDCMGLSLFTITAMGPLFAMLYPEKTSAIVRVRTARRSNSFFLFIRDLLWLRL